MLFFYENHLFPIPISLTSVHSTNIDLWRISHQLADFVSYLAANFQDISVSTTGGAIRTSPTFLLWRRDHVVKSWSEEVSEEVAYWTGTTLHWRRQTCKSETNCKFALRKWFGGKEKKAMMMMMWCEEGKPIERNAENTFYAFPLLAAGCDRGLRFISRIFLFNNSLRQHCGCNFADCRAISIPGKAVSGWDRNAKAYCQESAQNCLQLHSCCVQKARKKERWYIGERV